MLTLQDVRAALGRELLSERPGSARVFDRVWNDSRSAERGDLFVALATENRDGHDFAAAAVERGAFGVLAHREVDVPPETYVFRVRNTQRALGEIARHWRQRFFIKSVVVTGSVGKTTTKELIAAVLGSKYNVLKSPANFNDEVGLAMTLFQLTRRHERAVLEVGMFDLGEIRRLCEIAMPEIGVVTNVGPTHMERLGSLEAIAAAKAEAVEGLPGYGWAVLNADDALVSAMRERTKARVLTYGTGPGADVRGKDLQGRGLSGVEFTVSCAGRALSTRSSLPGEELVRNALAAIAVAMADGMSLEEAAAAVRHADVPGRLRAKKTRAGALVLDDSYNASPASTIAALNVLAGVTGRRFALLGDMLELGAAEAEGHAAVGRRAAEVVDGLFTVGERGRIIARSAREAGLAAVEEFDDKEKAAKVLAAGLGPGDVLLVKASHGVALETVVEELVR
jgi:UDP-N-acetylmuramoyl-tripeptide--D-alanyl-D-alanine ligase